MSSPSRHPSVSFSPVQPKIPSSQVTVYGSRCPSHSVSEADPEVLLTPRDIRAHG
jgi:hypothetical protein